MARTIDVDSVVETIRREEEARIQGKVDAVRTLATAAERGANLEAQLEEAQRAWAKAYASALEAGVAERDIARLAPSDVAKPRARRSPARPRTAAPKVAPASAPAIVPASDEA